MTHYADRIDPSELAEVAQIAAHVRSDGEQLGAMTLKWWVTEGAAALLETERSELLIESGDAGVHALTTVLTESVARLDYGGPILPGVIFRRQGNPDEHIKVGEDLNILGLPHHGRAFDPDTIYTVPCISGIRLLLRTRLAD